MQHQYKYETICKDGAEGLMSMEDNSIALIYGSPPYPNAERDYGCWKSSEYIEKMAPFFDAAYRKLRENGFLVVNVKANREKPERRGCTRRSLVVEKMAILLEERWHFYCVDIEIWIKENPVPTGLRVACQDAYEQILWFSKSPKWKINIDAIRRKYDPASLEAYSKNEYKPRTNGLSYVRKAKTISPNPLGALPLNIVCGSVSGKQSIHQAVQPTYLPQKYIEATTQEGDLVVDPWMGSGTTGLVAVRLKRNFVGFDIYQKYVDIANIAITELVNTMNMRASVNNERKELHENFLRHLGSAVEKSSQVDYRPLVVHLNQPAYLTLCVYLFPNTNPPGGRSFEEYKFNLNVPGQKRGEKGNFDESEGLPLLISYTKDYDVYVIYDASMHRNFSCNANVQSKLSLILNALNERVASQIKNNGEVLIGVTSGHLIDGLRAWLMKK